MSSDLLRDEIPRIAYQESHVLSSHAFCLSDEAEGPVKFYLASCRHLVFLAQKNFIVVTQNLGLRIIHHEFRKISSVFPDDKDVARMTKLV